MFTNKGRFRRSCSTLSELRVQNKQLQTRNFSFVVSKVYRPLSKKHLLFILDMKNKSQKFRKVPVKAIHIYIYIYTIEIHNGSTHCSF